MIAEWWRAKSARRLQIVVDAIVMASAATRGDIVFTSDIEDLQRLQQYFPGVRAMRV